MLRLGRYPLPTLAYHESKQGEEKADLVDDKQSAESSTSRADG